MIHIPTENDALAHATAFRALAAYLEFVKSIENVTDEEEYEEKLNMFVKGAGSTFLDQIDATGAYKRLTPIDVDPNFVEFSNSMTSMAIHGMQTLYDPTGFAAILGKLVNLDFCELLRQEIVKRNEEEQREQETDNEDDN